MNVYYVQPLRHAEGMAMAYLPAEKILHAGRTSSTRTNRRRPRRRRR